MSRPRAFIRCARFARHSITGATLGNIRSWAGFSRSTSNGRRHMQKLGTRAVLAAAALAALPSIAAAAITVQTTTNATTMVDNLVPAGSGVSVVDGSATYTGAAGASGTFTDANFLGTGFTSGV